MGYNIDMNNKDTGATAQNETIVLIDSNSILNRAFYAMPPFTDKEGNNVGAVYGFINMYIKLMQDYKPVRVAAAFDLPQLTFRHKMYDGYKAQRKKMPEELAVQIQPLKDLLKTLRVQIVEKAGFEADDVIGTLARSSAEKGYRVLILTGDRDSFQLIDDRVNVLLTRKGLSSIERVDCAALEKDYLMTPSQVVDYKAIAGDASDNIPGVRGIGEKGAHSLLLSYGTLDGIYENIDAISDKLKEKLMCGKDSAYLSRTLATIVTNVPLETDLDGCKSAFPFDRSAFNALDKLGFKSITRRSELFSIGEQIAVEQEETARAEVVTVKSADELAALKGDKFAYAIIDDNLHFAFDETTDYVVEQGDLLSTVTFDDAVRVLSDYFSGAKHLTLTSDLKAFKHAVTANADGEDVGIMSYLLNGRVQIKTASELFSAHERAEKKLAETNMLDLYEKIERPLVNVLFAMEREGFAVDLQLLDTLGAEFCKEAETSAETVYRYADKRFNINSPKQVAAVLFDEMNIPFPGRGAISTGAEVLEKLSGEYPIVDEILRYRTYTKLVSGFVEGLRKKTVNGRVHTTFNQTVTNTGRLSSTEPNLQNIPTRTDEGKRLRGVFIAKEGCRLVNADYSQIELKLLAHMSGDKRLIDAFKDGKDIHAVTASEIFSVPLDKVTAQMRREAKAVNFGLIYGISSFGLSRNINITQRDAKQYMQTYFEKYPAVKGFLDGLIEIAKERGYSETLFHRRRPIGELFSGKRAVSQFGERAAMNAPLQGSAADIIKIAMNKTFAALKGMKSKLVLQIHDELIVEADESEVDEVKRLLKDCMENAVELSVPLTVDVGEGKNWLECK